MVTFTGTQSDFFDALKDLVELELDAIGAYQAAIDRLDSEEYKKQLEKFKSQHLKHVEELSKYLNNNNKDVPKEPSTKQWLTKGKTILASLIGDKTILKAMHSNEEDTNTAYERMNNRNDVPSDIKDQLSNFFSDEKNHKLWLEQEINKN
jgi:rubrerythrin